MNKNIVAVLLLLTLALCSLAGCAEKPAQPSNDPAPVYETPSSSTVLETSPLPEPSTTPDVPSDTIEYTDNPNDLSSPIANLPRSDAVDLIWSRLSGYWTAGGDFFAGFEQDGVPCFTYGIYETSFGMNSGELINGEAVGEYEAVLTFRYPELPADEVTDARPTVDINVWIDVSGLDNDGKINIKIEDLGDGIYYTYAHNGMTAEEAYNNR